MAETNSSNNIWNGGKHGEESWVRLSLATVGDSLSVVGANDGLRSVGYESYPYIGQRYLLLLAKFVPCMTVT